MNNFMRILFALFIVLALLTGAVFAVKIDFQAIETLSDEVAQAPTEAPTEPIPEDKTVHIVAAGDNLVQMAVYREASYHAEDGGYNFMPLYENVRSIIESGDISILNQETIITNGDYEISGDNLNFNSPMELGYDMIELGFDVFTIANNHILDRGTDGIRSTLDYWDERCAENNIVVCGAYRDEEDMRNIRTMTKNDVELAFLSFTEHLNGYYIPDNSPYRVVETFETDVIEEQIRSADEISDCVIVAVHWGDEDTHKVKDGQRELAKDMISWGADVIIGTHSHTAETMEYIECEDGRNGFVFYSLGNFISAQTDNFNLVGEIADFDIVVDSVTNEVSVENVGIIPVINHYDDGRFSNMRLYPYSMYTDELAENHGVPYAPMGTAKDFGMDVIDRIIEENIPEEFRKLE